MEESRERVERVYGRQMTTTDLSDEYCLSLVNQFNHGAEVHHRLLFYEKEYHCLFDIARKYLKDLKTVLAMKIKWLQEVKDQDELNVEVDRLDHEHAEANAKVEELSTTVISMERHHLKEVDILAADRDTLYATCSAQQNQIFELEVCAFNYCRTLGSSFLLKCCVRAVHAATIRRGEGGS
jgi:hypothetical protein